MAQNIQSTGLKSVLITQLIACVVFILVPALITMAAPVTWLKLEKRPTGVAATGRQCVFFVIPFRTDTVLPATEVKEKIVSGRKFNQAEQRRGHAKQSADTGSLTISGPQGSATFSVAPTSLPEVARQAREFLAKPSDSPLERVVVANWIVSVVVGGIATFFTVLYVVGSIIAVTLWIIGSLRRIVRTLGPDGGDESASTTSTETNPYAPE